MSARALDSVGIVFCDLDDTFLRKDKSLVEKNMELLDRLHRRGIEFVPCTGRALHAIPPEVLGHPSVRFAIPADGSCVYSLPDEALIMDLTIGKRRALWLYEQLLDLPITIDVFADGSIYTERSRWGLIDRLSVSAAHRAFMRRTRTAVDHPLPEVIESTRVIERMGSFWLGGEEGLRCAKRIREVVDADSSLRHTASMSCGIEIVDGRASKGVALTWLCDHLGIPVSASVAFGDSPNDVEMLQAAGDGVAMANATPEALAAADHVTGSNEDGGVADYLL